MRAPLRILTLVFALELSSGLAPTAAQTTDTFSKAELDALLVAACDEDLKRVSAAIADGRDPNIPDEEGLLPLHRAVGCDIEAVRKLLAVGADPNARNPATDEAPLNLAASEAIGSISIGETEGVWSTFDLLLDGGADLNAPDSVGQTAMTKLAAFGHFTGVYEKIHELLDRGYTYDLAYLGRAIEVGKGFSSDEDEVWRQRVIEKLKAMGVDFPVGPRGPQLPPS